MAYDDILYSVSDRVATITINRPESRNSLRTHTYAELTQAFSDAADDHQVGVIVITGAGDKAFCAGGDVKSQKGRTPAGGRAHFRRVLALGTAMRNCGKPIIAAVRGYCIGGGHELHLFADLTVAADNATFGQVGPRVGMVPVWGATEILPRIVGEKRAREMIFTTRFYSAEEAENMGLVNKVVPIAELDAAVREMADQMLTMSPQSLRIAKLSLNYATDAMWPAFTHGAELVAALYGSPEQVEGARAFVEKRPPDYQAVIDAELRAESAQGGGRMTSAFYECLEVTSVGAGAIIRLNRPERRNALSNKLIFELTEAVSVAAADPDVRAIVLTGSATCFSAGADLSEAVSIDAVEFRAWSRRFGRLAEQIETAPKPVIAAISGYCITGGLELALVCDVRIASDTATFAMTSTRIGSVAGFGGTQRLPRVVGVSNAKRLMFRAEAIDAAEAHRIGLVDAVVPVGELAKHVADEVELYATRGPLSLAMTKRAVDNGMRVDLRSGLEIETDIVAQVFATEDKVEGMRAFLDKRTPRFRGQ